MLETYRMKCVVLAALAGLAVMPCSAKAAEAEAKPLILVPGGRSGAVQSIGGRYALIVSINDYSQVGLPNLKYCDKGALEVKDALVQYGGFPAENVTVFQDAKATKENILLYLDSLRDAHTFREADTFLLYFSGHGGIVDYRSGGPDVASQRDNLLVPYNGSTEPALAGINNVPVDAVKRALQDSVFPRKIVLLDACRNLLQTGSSKSMNAERGFDFAHYAAFAKGLKIYIGCEHGQCSFEDDELADGVFTHFVLLGLKGAPGAADGQGVVTLAGLESYVGGQMLEYSRNNPAHKQSPMVLGGEGSEAIPLTLTTGALGGPGPATAGSGAPSPRADAERARAQGLQFEASGQTEQALAAYSQAVRLDPAWAKPHNNLGFLYANQHRLDDAQAEFETALQLDPSFAWAANNLGLLYARDRHDLVRAEAAFKQAISLDPHYAYPHSNLGNLYSQQGRSAEAVREFQAAIALDPEYATAHFNLAILYGQLDRLADSIAEFEATLRIDPAFPKAQDDLAQVRSVQAGGG